MDDPWNRPTFVSAVFYEDPRAALGWLERAFGFETSMVITGDDGAVAHAEMKFGDGLIMVGGLWTDTIKTPKAVGGCTQSLHVYLKGKVDDHCERARAEGAVIAMEPADQFYGDRVYVAVDPEGHRWSFGQTVAQVSREEAEKASGLKIEGWV